MDMPGKIPIRKWDPPIWAGVIPLEGETSSTTKGRALWPALSERCI